MKEKFLRWFAAAGIRAVRTFAQTAVATVGGNLAGVVQVDWVGAFSISATAAIISMLTSIAGLPELEIEQDDSKG